MCTTPKIIVPASIKTCETVITKTQPALTCGYFPKQHCTAGPCIADTDRGLGSRGRFGAYYSLWNVILS
jgi:hypothetical protein